MPNQFTDLLVILICMNFATSLIELLRASVEVRHLFVKHVKITPRSKDEKRMSMLIYNNLVQKGDSILALVDSDKAVGVEVVARSAFENYIDLINLFKHRPEYLDYIKYMSLAQQERGINNLIKNRCSMLAASTTQSLPEKYGITVEQSLEMVKEEKLECGSRLSRTYTAGNKPISEPRSKVNTTVKLRSELAGHLEEYETLYGVLSRSTHSDFLSMLNGVFKGGGYTWPPESPAPSLWVIDFVTMMIHETTDISAKKLRKPFPAVRKLIEERRRLGSTRQ